MSAAAAYPTASWYPTPQADDGNEWFMGRCWLYCRREDIPVVWVGPASTPNGSRPMYACQSCMAELDYIVRDEQRRHDLGQLTPAQPLRTPVPHHTGRRPTNEEPDLSFPAPARPATPTPRVDGPTHRRPAPLAAFLHRMARRCRGAS